MKQHFSFVLTTSPSSELSTELPNGVFGNLESSLFVSFESYARQFVRIWILTKYILANIIHFYISTCNKNMTNTLDHLN